MDRAHRLGEPVGGRSAPFHICAFGMAAAVFAGFAFPLTASAQDGGGTGQARGPRVIAPELVAPLPVDPSMLERIEPRQPLSGLAGPAPEPKLRKEDALFFRPVAVAAGMFESEGRTVTIAGIRVIPPDRTCEARDGGAWPCGVQARTAFRYWLRGRAIACESGPGGEPPDTDKPLTCSLAGYDIGKWLIENGWAMPEPGGPYEQDGENARRAGKGIFSGGPSSS
ncbi:hypothetical protein NA8A_02010 [Nitratireductor indicus C115]|uniref:Nuclease n=1 Tax=Nitratireductor indicus C115 TaxID=1231190 RepID=K2NA25_9HYPH|nr:hypothetical protein NA8A_02010 [Nitratireductor indicus C115]SFQ30162.1 hypothetical protein SAMN05216176_102407 [Nitratireductor indicus]